MAIMAKPLFEIALYPLNFSLLGEIGEMRMLVKQVRKGRVTIEEAAEDAGMTVEEFKKILENTPLQAV